MELKEFKTNFGGKELIIETGLMANLASGAVTVRCGGTVVLATTVVLDKNKEENDFFPLLVDYEERLYAAGKISGSRFIKREGRPSEVAVLTCRMIDRALRPLFPKDFRSDVQVVITVLSIDEENDPDIISLIAASCSLILSTPVFEGPIAAVRIGMDKDGEKEKFLINPSFEQIKNSPVDLVAAITSKGKVIMIEARADMISKDKILEAIKLAKEEIKPAIDIQKEFEKYAKQKAENKQKELEKEKSIKKEKSEDEYDIKTVHIEMGEYLGAKLKKAVREVDKEKRESQIAQFEKEALENFEGNYKQIDIKNVFGVLLEKEVRQAILKDDIRPDGRKIEEIRPLDIKVGLLPRTHGSALFSRGQTQVLSIVTLGGPGAEQIIETMEEEGTKRYMHHYNFPPFSTGEVKPLRGASRREIGHGALAEKALLAALPSKEEFPYTVRVVSEVLSSNGSSSMASVCGSSLALMDAGAPIRRAVAGIAIGLISSDPELTKYKILTDIQGIEDFAGDMDFKVAGTVDGITAIQLDTKTKGLNDQIIEEALNRAEKAYLEILKNMEKVIAEPRSDLSPYAPRITTVQIDPEKIGELIGPGGKTINNIIDQCGGKTVISIDIEDNGLVMVSSTDAEMSKKAVQMIDGITREIKIGEIFEGEVVQIICDRNDRNKEIGAIVKISPNKEGMIHISQITNYMVRKVSDLIKVGDILKVQVIDVDSVRGRISLSRKALLTDQK